MPLAQMLGHLSSLPRRTRDSKQSFSRDNRRSPGNDETPNVENTWDPSEFNTVLITKCKDYLTVIGAKDRHVKIGCQDTTRRWQHQVKEKGRIKYSQREDSSTEFCLAI